MNEDSLKELVIEAIKQRETFILKKHGMEINTDIRIEAALERTSVLSSIFLFLCCHLASKGRSHLFLREPDEEKMQRD